MESQKDKERVLNNMMKRLILPLILLCFSCAMMPVASAQNGFIVHRVDIQGLHRIRRATVMDYMPVRPGQRLYSSQMDNIIRTLYTTGFFSNVSLHREHDDLVIVVVERPTIAQIDISGNHDIKHKKLDKALKKAGVARGLVLDKFSLNTVRQAILDEYRKMGLRNAQVLVSTSPLPRNRVIVLLLIVWSVDIGAYITGKLWGTRKFAPQISPGKTLVGFWGGILAVLPIAVVMGVMHARDFREWALWLIVVFSVALVSVIGDLFESVIKRIKGVKDSGTLLPGHGGILDRIDSLLAAAPFFAAYVLLS